MDNDTALKLIEAITALTKAVEGSRILGANDYWPGMPQHLWPNWKYEQVAAEQQYSLQRQAKK